VTDTLGALADSLLWVPVHYGYGGVIVTLFVAWMAGWLGWGALLTLAERRSQHVPAAPDNTPGTDMDLLIQCRRINRQPLARKENRSRD
jgi:hypothetical protein